MSDSNNNSPTTAKPRGATYRTTCVVCGAALPSGYMAFNLSRCVPCHMLHNGRTKPEPAEDPRPLLRNIVGKLVRHPKHGDCRVYGNICGFYGNGGGPEDYNFGPADGFLPAPWEVVEPKAAYEPPTCNATRAITGATCELPGGHDGDHSADMGEQRWAVRRRCDGCGAEVTGAFDICAGCLPVPALPEGACPKCSKPGAPLFACEHTSRNHTAASAGLMLGEGDWHSEDFDGPALLPNRGGNDNPTPWDPYEDSHCAWEVSDA